MAKDTRARVIVGIDTGGTFTDVTLLDPATGRVWTAKTPSTPSDPSQGFGNGIAEVLKVSNLTGADIARVLHGTTVATNLILEGKGARAALITTDGFKYVLEIGRQDVPRRASLFAWVKPKRPVPPEHIFEVAGRVGPDGRELAPLDEAAVREAARAIRAQGIGSIAVVLLHSYANPAHERRVAEILTEEIPGALLSLSSEVLPVFREYERSMTTILNAAVMPVVSTYVERLDARVAERGIEAPLLLMKSSGGVTSTRHVRRAPVETALSGPAAGAVGAAYVGAASGHPNLIGIDIGGTSADISLIHGGEPGLTTNGRVGGWPVGLPMVDMVTIGAGGGSIARVSDTGALTVGPESAGAIPGPVCYGRGGVEPTVTDAHLALGHLPPYLLGGTFALDVESARTAVETRVARPLGLSLEEAARGILAVVDNNMVGAIRVVSVERGHDPRDFTLVAFGGAGPLHACELADELGIRKVLVPAAAGVLSALGLVASEERRDRVRSYVIPFDHAGLLPREGEVDLRYRGQSFELTVPLEGDPAEAFHRAHEERYGYAERGRPLELVAVRTAKVIPVPALTLPGGEPLSVRGPTVIELDGASCWLPPGWEGVRDGNSTLVLTRQ